MCSNRIFFWHQHWALGEEICWPFDWRFNVIDICFLRISQGIKKLENVWQNLFISFVLRISFTNSSKTHTIKQIANQNMAIFTTHVLPFESLEHAHKAVARNSWRAFPYPPHAWLDIHRNLKPFVDVFHLAGRSANLVEAFDLRELPGNTTKAAGPCLSRPRRTGGGYEEDIAYRMETSSRAMSVPTRFLFPRLFPETFVIMATIRAAMDNRGSLFSVFDSDGHVSLAFTISPVGLVYRTRSGETKSLSFSASLADNKWHRIAVGVGKNMIIMVADCETEVGVESYIDKPHDFPSYINTTGETILGSQLQDETNFRVSIGRFSTNNSANFWPLMRLKDNAFPASWFSYIFRNSYIANVRRIANDFSAHARWDARDLTAHAWRNARNFPAHARRTCQSLNCACLIKFQILLGHSPIMRSKMTSTVFPIITTSPILISFVSRVRYMICGSYLTPHV